MELERIHRKLLIDISNHMMVDSMEYGNFTECMKIYVPKGTLAEKKTLLDKFEALESKGHLKPGQYEKLKDICISSGNRDIVDIIQEAERKIKEILPGQGAHTKIICEDDEVPAKKPKLDFNAFRNDLVEKYREYFIKTEFIPWKPEEGLVDIDEVYSPVYMQRRVKSSGEKNIQQRNNYIEKQEQNESKSTGKQKTNKHTNKLKLKIPNNKQRKNKQKYKPISYIHELFYYNNKSYKKILIKADSGAGKTTLCRKLISLWCQQSEDRLETGACAAAEELKEFIYVTDEDMNTEGESMEALMFDFLFYVSLRHAKQEEYIEDMIVRQLQIMEEDLQQILDTKNCLVIVDGLDEWSPHRHVHYGPMDIKGCPKEKRVGKFYSVFTTRPWKLVDEARDADKLELQCQLKGVQTYEEMITLYAQLIKARKEFSTKKFLEDVGYKTQFLSTPLLLKLVMLLWAESGELEESDCRLYGRVVELLIKSGLERNVNDCEFTRKVNEIHLYEEVPLCFNKSDDFSHLSKYFSAIKQVAKVSFETLLKGTLLLKDTDVQIYTEKFNIDLLFLRKLGLFSQSPHIGGSFIDRESKVTFIHKSFQEFYAAVHIVSNPEDCYRILKEKWSKSETESTNARAVVLSGVFKFVSGMDPSAMPKMYKLIFMYIFDDINAAMLDVYQCHTDKCEKFKIHFRERYGCIVKQNLASNACRNRTCGWLPLEVYPIDILLETFNEHIRENITEILKCGHSDFEIHITDLSLCFHEIVSSQQCSETLDMFKVLKYISPSSLKTLVLQYKTESDLESSREYDVDELYDMDGDILPVCFNLWSGECSNLIEVKLINISLTYKQMERVLMIHPSKLEIIILDNVECCSHKTVSEMCTNIKKGKSLEKFGFSEMQINEIIRSEHFEHVGFSEIKLSTTFVMLKELTLAYIDGVLTHSQITHMMTDSPSLQCVSFAKVYCKEDGYCGCLEAVNDEEIDDAFCKNTSTASSVKQLRIENSSGITCHTNSYPELKELTLEDIDEELTHSQITHMLTDSPSLQSVSLVNVHCKEDGYCGCLEAVNDEEIDDAFCKNTSTASSVKQLSIENSSGIVCHTNSYPQLEEFYLNTSDIKKVVLPSQILSHLTNFAKLQNVNMLNRSQTTNNGSSNIGDNGEGRSELQVCCLKQKLKLSSATDVSICSRLNALRVVNLYNIEIGHSHITLILTLPFLDAYLSNVVCTADNMCGCYAQSGTSDLSLALNPEPKCVESRLKELTLCGGKEFFKHVSKLLELRTVCFKGIEEIDNVFLTGQSLEKVELLEKEKTGDYVDLILEDPTESCCKISQEFLLRFLDSISNSCLVELNKINLTTGDADCVYETLCKMRTLEVQEFTKWKLLEPTAYQVEVEPGVFVRSFAFVKTSSKTKIVSLIIQKKQQDMKDKDESDSR